jgi:hypothetical protein
VRFYAYHAAANFDCETQEKKPRVVQQTYLGSDSHIDRQLRNRLLQPGAAQRFDVSAIDPARPRQHITPPTTTPWL